MVISSPTLQSLITSVREFLNQSDPNNSFWTDKEITDHLNEGVRVYFSELTNINEGHFTTTVDLNIVSGSETIACPSDFFEIRNLYRKVSNGYALLNYRNNLTSGYSTDDGSSSNCYLPSYYLRGNSIVLRNPPNFSETAGLKLEYIFMPDSLINGGDSLTSQVSPVFKQVIIMYAVYKCKIKESLTSGVNTYSIAGTHLNELIKQFKDTVQLRSKGLTKIIPFIID